jgi:hypothetical protein
MPVAGQLSNGRRVRAWRTPAKRDSKAATRGDVSESMTSEFDGPNEEVVHCILERALAEKRTAALNWIGDEKTMQLWEGRALRRGFFSGGRSGE